MNRKLRFRLPKETTAFYEIFVIQFDFGQFLKMPVRCPKCGAKQLEDDVVAGMRQYALPLDFEDYDEWLLLLRCHECGARYGYQARIDPDR